MSWLALDPGNGFGLDHLPYGICEIEASARAAVRVGDEALDLLGLAEAGLLDLPVELLDTGSLNAFMACGPETWRSTRERLTELLTDAEHEAAVRPHLHPIAEALLPFEVGDYVDFYSSIEHATNLGRMFRPDGEALLPNWRWLPIGYHGRAGTVVVSGTPVRRPRGQRKAPTEAAPSYAPSARLDIEAEVGFVIGVGSEQGVPLTPADVEAHVFGVVLVNDWSARDLQAWEYQPLGPFLGKSFATTVSGWVTPLAALQAARVQGPVQDPPPLEHLACDEPWGLDLQIEVVLNGEVVSRPPFAGMYWSMAQQLAHATSNGASVRTGDLFASGTVSGRERDQRGSLIELSWNGAEPLVLADGSTRSFLEDGDEVVLRATAPAPGGGRLSLGESAGRVVASLAP